MCIIVHVAWSTSVTLQSNLLPNSISIHPVYPLHTKRPHIHILYKVSWVIPAFSILSTMPQIKVPLP